MDQPQPIMSTIDDLWKSYNVWAKDCRPSDHDQVLKSTSFRLKVTKNNPMGDPHPCVRLLVHAEPSYLVIDLLTASKALKAYDISDIDYHPLFRKILKLAEKMQGQLQPAKKRRYCEEIPISIFINDVECIKAIRNWQEPGTQKFSPPNDKLVTFFFSLLRLEPNFEACLLEAVFKQEFEKYVKFEQSCSNPPKFSPPASKSVMTYTFLEMLLAFNKTRLNATFVKNARKRKVSFAAKFETVLDLDNPIGISFEKIKIFSQIVSSDPLIGQLITEVLLATDVKKFIYRDHLLTYIAGHKLSTFKMIEEFANVNPFTNAHLLPPVKEEFDRFLPKLEEYYKIPFELRPYCVLTLKFEPDVCSFPRLAYAAKMYSVRENGRKDREGLKTRVPENSQIIRARVKETSNVCNTFAAAKHKEALRLCAEAWGWDVEEVLKNAREIFPME